MKTLVLLSALVLLAFLVQADPIQDAEEETKTEEQPGKEDQGVYALENVESRSSLKSKLKKALGSLLRKTMKILGVHRWEVHVKIN